ncbi:RES domain-containing protein [Solitalea lacus]|uniref:RES domain-containing protein n=1 Tax=Solitalea lacus TaxID=2911172 RepID=UPI001EDB0AEC|nr:RES domain-containing protein [Solitalea lacus]UKJ06197.1 RES domain-containing protein [Solitalea lacus]
MKQGEIRNIQGSSKGRCKITFIMDSIFALTGRKVRWTTENGEINKWAMLSTSEQLKAHPFYERLKNDINNVKIKEVTSLFYRGINYKNAPSKLNMGPPPREKAKSNRYSSNGEIVLYLSDSPFGVLKECNFENGKTLWCQEYKIPQNLKIANLSYVEPDTFLSCIMWHADLSEEDDEKRGENYNYPKYVFSQTIAEIFKNKYDGIYVFGVRSDDTQYYHNLVIFEPDKKWDSWLENEPMKLL